MEHSPHGPGKGFVPGGSRLVRKGNFIMTMTMATTTNATKERRDERANEEERCVVLIWGMDSMAAFVRNVRREAKSIKDSRILMMSIRSQLRSHTYNPDTERRAVQIGWYDSFDFDQIDESGHRIGDWRLSVRSPRNQKQDRVAWNLPSRIKS